jgi:hypothetical protein
MKKLVTIVAVGLLLVPLMASPALAWRGGGGGGWHRGGGGWHGGGGCCWGSGFGVGVGIGVLATAPFWYPRYAYPAYAYPAYPYPAYGYPAYSYPAYGYPVYPAPAPPPPPPPPDPGASFQPSQSTNMTLGTPVANPPAAANPAPAVGQNCAMVTVDGHNEIRTLSNGQTVTTWIATSTQQVCQ